MLLLTSLLTSLLQLCSAHSENEPYLRRGDATVWPPYPETPITYHNYDYVLGNVTYEGYIAYPTDEAGPLPGMVISHQYLGLGLMEQFRSRQMASYGFVVFAIDTYGKYNRPANSSQAIAQLTVLRGNPTLYHSIMVGGFDLIRNLGEGPVVDQSTLFANGYCAGGQVVFELARLGIPGLIGVSGFHPSISPLQNTSLYTSPNAYSAAFQCHWAQLDNAGNQGLLDFETEMLGKNVTHWTTFKYGNCKHGWTDPTSSVYRAMEAADATGSMRQFTSNLLGRTDQLCTSPAPTSNSNAVFIGLTIGFGVVAVASLAYVWKVRSSTSPADNYAYQQHTA